MTEDSPQAVPAFNELAEGYPTLDEVVRAIIDDDKVPNVAVRQVQINCFASGDATYNVWILGEDEPQGNYLDIHG